ncbi:MAG: T9SS type A sorting domain-containing protein [Flavobacteriales bacterium]|nr:T9SS type A sorting domain-containing protein [Flavobacteriales bacterium]
MNSRNSSTALWRRTSLWCKAGVLGLVLSICGSTTAQVATTYTFSQAAGTFTPLTGGTAFAQTAVSASPFTAASMLDDVIFNLPTGTIPFTFTYNGIGYTGMNISANGFITFGATAPGTGLYTPLSGSTGYAGAISGYGRDVQGGYAFVGSITTGSNTITGVTGLNGVAIGEEIVGTGIPAATTITGISGTPPTATITISANATATNATAALGCLSGEIRYGVDPATSAPNRVFVIQFSNFKPFGTGGTTPALVTDDFQIRLAETTNNIQIVYGATVGGATAITGEVGLRGPNNTFATNVNNRLVNGTCTCDWATSVVGTANNSTCRIGTGAPAQAPTNGLTYTWTAPAPPLCSAPSITSVTQLTATTASVSWTGAALGVVEWGTSGCVAGTANTAGACGSVVLGSSPQTITGLVANTTYSVYVRQNCTGAGNGYSTNASTTYFNTPTCPSGLGSAITVGSLPYAITGQTTCGAGNNVTSTNVASVCGSTSYYGAEDKTYIFTPTVTGVHNILLTTAADYDAGIMLYQGCPFTPGSTCIGNAQSTSGLTRTLTPSLTNGVTYYLVVDNFPAPACMATYALNIDPPAACPVPTAVAAGSVTATTASISWTCTGCTGTFELDYGANPHTAGTGTIITGVTSAYVLNPPLTPSTGYQVFIRQNCGVNGFSSWSSGATFTTLAPPPVCPGGLGTGVVSIPSLPYATTAQTTCGSGNNVTSANVASVCGSTNYYSAEDRTYIFTPTVSGVHNILLTTGTDDDAGIMLYQGCPFTGGSTCVANAQNTTGLTRTLAPNLSSGVTYYLVVDNWTSPACIGTYSLNIDPPVACPTPTAVAAGSVTSTSAAISWTCTGCTGSFELDYGPNPHTAGTGTIITGVTSGYVLNPPLTPSTGYQVFVRQDCTGGGNGFGAWSSGATFTTTAPPPASDVCSGAIAIPIAGPFPYTTAAVTLTSATDAGDPVTTCQTNSHKGVWFTFSPPVTGSYTISSCQSAAAGSTVTDNILGIYTSTAGCAGPFTQVACDDDGCTTLNLQAVVTTTLNCGTTYYILASAYDTNVGDVQLNVVAPTCTVAAFNVTGGGAYCAGGTGVSVGLSGSALCTNYQLFFGATPLNTLAGTGSALDFGLQTAAGTYTVVATNATFGACTGSMTGSATVSIQAQPVAGTNGTLTICAGSTVTAPQLFAALGGTPDGGGNWSPTLAGGGTYTYTVNATAPCTVPATAQVVVSEQAQPNAGTNGTLNICINAASVNLIASLGGSPDGGGSWTDPSNNPHSGTFVPGTDAAGVYTYTVNATAPCVGSVSATVTVTYNNTDTDGDAVIDCLDNCPSFPGVQGGSCDANPGPGFSLGTISNSCTCVPVACTNNVVLELRPDAANSGDAGWEILDQNTNLVICSGGYLDVAYPDGVGTPITESCCLASGCYRLRVYDQGGDGFVDAGVTGGYQLRESGANGRRIIDNFGNFINLAGGPPDVSAIANTYDNGAFCVPLGNDRPIFSSCDKLDWVNDRFIVATENSAVSAQYNVTNATSGYEFWFFDPNGSYSFRRFRSHATSDGTGTGATRACHFRINSWVNSISTPHIPASTLLNVRIRGRVAGVNQPFGPACLFKIDAARAACPLTKLQDNSADADFSCGVNKVFGGSNSNANKLVAAAPQFTPTVASSNVRYQFRFRIPGEYPNAGSCIVRPVQTSPTIYLNWLTGDKLRCNTQYQVDVRVSKDGGATWCVANADPTCASPETIAIWGKVCNVNITTSTYCPGPAQGGGSNFAAEGNGDFTMYPNPNRGDQLFLSLSKVADGVNTVSVDLYDMTGKRAMARTIAVQDGFVNTPLALNGDLAGGVYLVNITAGDKTYTQRLVIQP